ncbi:nitrile hydratase accessory protein [Variovorax rhizosphaerae]|uniref:Nitrile hydratase accessory protein n=1 Tax=Variovorax rhizosphaerae TaxID=1836200 RepID=A0ABU8WTS0_9BURK
MITLPQSLDHLPMQDGEPVFREPWEAQAFAMVVSLHAQGLFTWREWTAALSTQIRGAREAGEADLGDTYYHHWLTALECLVALKGAGTAEELERYRLAWDRAAERTSHGKPIELRQEDFQAMPAPTATEVPSVDTPI